MRLDRHLLAAMLAPGAALATWLVAGIALLGATLGGAGRTQVAAVLGPLVETHGMVAVGWWLIGAVLAAWAGYRLHAAYVAAPARLAAATRVLVEDPAAPDVAADECRTVRDLAAAINALAAARRALQAGMERQVEEASGRIAEQRDQLGALMAQLDQSVVVCNLDGRILLYNARARALVRRLSRAPGSDGAELIGLGRSIHAVIAPALIAHARETIERRIERGTGARSARFVTTMPGGRLVRVGLAPVGEGARSGFVLQLDDITEDQTRRAGEERRLRELTEASRARVASMQAALDMLDYPDLEPESRARFVGVVRDEVAALAARLSAQPEGISAARWPLQEVLGTDLLDAAARRIEAATGDGVATDEADPGLWLNVDSFGVIEALSFLAGKLVATPARPELRLRLAAAGSRAHLDLAWAGGAVGREDLAGWQTTPLRGGDEALALTVRDVAERHDGEVWLERDRAGGAFFRFLLPQAREPEAVAEGRPEFYDFDLFAASEASRALDDRALSELVFTVFDTETTGFDPAEDEIIQIGATRIVNGRLLRGECFDQLVDPQRSLPEVGIRVHGIRPEMVRGQPTIAEVLPAFHAFAGDTVLVGHNVAFDMRFLELGQAATGVRFDQPVLDTLLLASLLDADEQSCSLESLSARLGTAITDRHTALGDALATADIFLKLIPLLARKGIVTLGQARAAAETSYYARLRY